MELRLKNYACFHLIFFCFFHLFLFFVLDSNAQDQKKIDNLQNKILTSGQDTSKVNSLSTLSNLYRDFSSDSALKFARRGLSLAIKTNYKRGIALCDYNIGCSLSDISKFQESSEYFNKSLQIFKVLNDQQGLFNNYYEMSFLKEVQGDSKKSLYFDSLCFEMAQKLNIPIYFAKCYNNYGSIYFKLSDYEKAMSYFIKTLKIFEKLNDFDGIANTCNNIGQVFVSQKFFGKASEYCFKGLKIAEKSQNHYLIAQCNFNLGNIFLEINDLNSASYNYRNALKHFDILKNGNGIACCNLNLGIVYKKMEDFELSRKYFLQSSDIFEKTGDNFNKAIVYENLASICLNLKGFNEAINYGEKCIALAKKISCLNNISRAYLDMSNAFDSLGNSKEAFRYYKLYNVLNDSIFNIEKTKKISELVSKYENEKKEREISNLSKKLLISEFKISRFYLISAIAVLLIILTAIIINIYRKKRIRKMLCLKILETEENDKKYFAQELHDGLNSVLISLKWFNNLISKTIDITERNALLEKSEKCINEALETSKSISNKLAPIQIKNCGLFDAIKILIKNVNAFGELNIHFKNNCSENLKINLTTEIVFYRIISELINNTLKHAEAKNISIEFNLNNNNLSLMYIDDGNGFDYNKAIRKSEKGIGLNNIINRTKIIDGKLYFNSKIGAGTNVRIEVKI